MSVDLVLTVVVTLALVAVIVAAALGAAGLHVRAAETASDEVGDDAVAMLAAWRNEATR